MVEQICEAIGSIIHPPDTLDSDGGSFIRVKVLVDISYHSARVGSSLWKIEGSNGYHSSTNVYPTCAIGVGSSLIEIEIVINGLIVKANFRKKINNSAFGSRPHLSKLCKKM